MDTKWNKCKAGVSFVCFLLGGLLLLASIPLGVLGVYLRIDLSEALQSNYQNTQEFRQVMANMLDDLLDLSVRGAAAEEYAAVIGDRNIHAEVAVNGKRVYSTGSNKALSGLDVPGYNFYLLFDGTKVTIFQDDKEVDVYGDGHYRQGRDWNVPGYANYPVRRYSDKRVGVELAAPVVPALYQGGGACRLYYMAQNFAQTRQAILWLCAIPAGGVLLFGLYLLWRRDKKRADVAVAGVTGRIWAEFKLIGLLFVLYSLWYSLGRQIPYLMIPVALLLFYVCLNDLRYNGWHKITRHSLYRTLFHAWRCVELKRPVEKRLQCRAVAIFIGMTPFALGTMAWGWGAFQFVWSYSPRHVLLVLLMFFLALLGLLLLLAQIWFLGRGLADAHELALLTDQIEALRVGDFSAPADLPQDADLRAAAEALAGLRQGMESAIGQRTRSERMKVELITNVSHDLKTPLTSVVSYAELLSREEELPDHVRDYIAILNDKAQRLKAMVGDVFEVSKAASGALALRPERLDLGKLLRQTLADMEGPISEHGQKILTTIPEEPVYLNADGDRLYRVFQNLLQNALQYSQEGTRVYLTLAVGGGEAVATMKNISRAPLPPGLDLTERFVWGDVSRTDGGSGLGLAIASSFTAACGGKFSVRTDADLFTAEVAFPVLAACDPP